MNSQRGSACCEHIFRSLPGRHFTEIAFCDHNSQFVYIAIIVSSQYVWYSIGTEEMTATFLLHMIPPHTKTKPLNEKKPPGGPQRRAVFSVFFCRVPSGCRWCRDRLKRQHFLRPIQEAQEMLPLVYRRRAFMSHPRRGGNAPCSKWPRGCFLPRLFRQDALPAPEQRESRRPAPAR